MSYVNTITGTFFQYLATNFNHPAMWIEKVSSLLESLQDEDLNPGSF